MIVIYYHRIRVEIGILETVEVVQHGRVDPDVMYKVFEIPQGIFLQHPVVLKEVRGIIIGF